MDRRKFIGSIAALGVQGMLLDAAGAVSLLDASSEASCRRKKKAGLFDENLVAIISDLHTNPDGYQPARLERTIADILALNPRPRNIIALGDLAYLTGKPSEYARLKEILKPLDGSGIKLTMAMGNHDKRKNFAEAFPECAAGSQTEDRLVFVVETPRADIILLDSLQESPEDDKWITPGAVPDNEKEWLRAKLATYTEKPVFVTAHHPIAETDVKEILLDSPTCCGYIYGHNHIWNPGWIRKNYSERRLIRTLCVPSTGHWGDIGYALLSLGEDQAEVKLREYEFFFPNPLEEGEKKPAQWAMIEQENDGSVCRFSYK